MQIQALIQWDDAPFPDKVIFETDLSLLDDEDDDVVFYYGTPVVGEFNSDGWTVIAIEEV